MSLAWWPPHPDEGRLSLRAGRKPGPSQIDGENFWNPRAPYAEFEEQSEYVMGRLSTFRGIVKHTIPGSDDGVSEN